MKIISQIIRIAMVFFAFNSSGYAAQKVTDQSILQKLNVPEGFKISIFANALPNARSMALGDNGVVYVGTLKQGDVYAVQDTNGDGKADQRYVIASELTLPNGVAFHDGSLYVAEVSRIIRFDNISTQLSKPPQSAVVSDRFPVKLHHGWKYLRFGPDGRMYTAIGAPCNICDPENKIFTSLVSMDADGSDFEILARGIRNTVGFDWQPGTNALFFTDNGRDYLGDDAPLEELNQWVRSGQHFGYPYCHGGDIVDPEFGKHKQCKDYTAPVWTFQAHMAPLGIRFYRGDAFPEQYRKQLFVAQHGSWNRSQAQGYRVVVVKFNQGRPDSEQVFIDGWLTKTGEVLGRPVDILEMPDGSLLVSDDKRGVIYRIEYKK